MNKKIKFIPMYLLLIFSFMFVFVKAKDVIVRAACNNTTATSGGECEIQEYFGSIKITNGGDITVQYQYGVSEILINAREYLGPVKDGVIQYGKEVVVFASGEKTTNGNVKKIHLSNYFDKKSEVQVRMLYSFYSGYGVSNPKYCNLDKNSSLIQAGQPCEGLYNQENGKEPNKFSAYARIKTLYSSIEEYNKVSVYLLDNNHLVYEFNNSAIPTSLDSGDVNTMVTIDNAAASESSSKGVNEIIFDTVIPVLLAILGLAATVTVVSLGYQIIKSSDEASERSEKIGHLRSILIGLAIAFALLAVLEPVIEFVKKRLE